MEKKNRADIEADEYFEMQKRVSGRAKSADAIILVFFALVLVAVALAVWILPQEPFGEYENRYLTTLDKIEFLQDIKSGTLTKKLTDMYADQFPFRNEFIRIKAALELAAQRRENGGVMLCDGGTLVPRLEYSKAQKNTISENVAAIENFAKTLQREGTYVTFAVAPRSVDIFSDRLSIPYSSERAKSAWEELSDVDYVNLFSEIKPRTEEYVWFKTDHHWTARGAYYAYSALAEKLSFSPLPMFEFEFSTLSESFYGTAWSKSGMYWIDPDEVEGVFFEGIEKFSVQDGESGETRLLGLYDLQKLETKDKYSAFLGGDYGHIRISDEKEKPSLLVIKDSYFNLLAPFLCQHFELDVIDLRYYQGSVSDYAKKTEANNILILCGLDSLAAAKTFTLLGY